MKNRLKINHDVTLKQYDYIMGNLNNFINDSTNLKNKN